MQPSQQLIDDIFREKVLRARTMPLGQKLAVGIQLFEEGLGWMRAGIKMQHPELSPEQAHQLVHKRLARARAIEEHGIYQATQP